MLETLAVHIKLESVPKEIKVRMEFGLPFHGFTFNTLTTFYDKNGRELKPFRREKIFEYQQAHLISEPYSYQFKMDVPDDIYNEISTVKMRFIYNQFELATPILERNKVQENWVTPRLIQVEHMSRQDLIRLFDYE